MLYQHTSIETPEIFLHSSRDDNENYPYVYGVIIPYSSNIREPMGTLKEGERLSFYSAIALSTSIMLYNHGIFQKIVLFSDATFGKERKSTGILMKEALLRAHIAQHIQESDIILFESNHLNNTPAQIKELSKYQLKNNLSPQLFLIIDWGFHDWRIRKYLQGFRMKTDTITVEEANKYYNPKFQLEKLQQILPKAFEEREKKLRFLAHFDRRGYIPRCLKLLTGPVVTDIQKIREINEFSFERKQVHLVFDNVSGKEKLRLMAEKNIGR